MARIEDHIAFSLTAAELKRIGRVCGWAPGSYMGKCGDCGGETIGDKRSVQCFACAVGSLKQQLETAALDERERCVKIVEKANWAASSEAIIARIRSTQETGRD